jgi:hypothetical protein
MKFGGDEMDQFINGQAGKECRKQVQLEHENEDNSSYYPRGYVEIEGVNPRLAPDTLLRIHYFFLDAGHTTSLILGSLFTTKHAEIA